MGWIARYFMLNLGKGRPIVLTEECILHKNVVIRMSCCWWITDSRLIEDFNESFVAAWKATHNYKQLRCERNEALHSIPLGFVHVHVHCNSKTHDTGKCANRSMFSQDTAKSLVLFFLTHALDDRLYLFYVEYTGWKKWHINSGTWLT